MEIKRADYTSPVAPGKGGFEDLDCYKLVLDIIANAYELAKNLPPEEKYDLAVQIRRSSKNIAANIAEGYGRFHYLDSLRFYSIARGELNETLAHYINARVLGYITPEYFESIHRMIRQAEMALNGYMKYIRRQQAGRQEYGDRFVSEPPPQFDVD